MQLSRVVSAELPPLRQERLKGAMMRLAAITAFSVMAAAIKLAYDHDVNTPEMMFYRSLFGLPPLLGWIVWLGQWDAWRTQRPLAHLGRGVIGLASMTLAFSALWLLPLAEATTISFAAPLFALALSAPFLGERVGKWRWAAVIAGFIGVIVVMRPGGDLPLQGTSVAIGAAVGVACVTVALRMISRTESTSTIVLWFTIFSVLVTGLLMPWFGQWHDARTWGLLLAVGLCGGLGQIFLTASLRFAPIATLAPIDYVQLVYAVLLGWLIWGSQPAWTTWLGAAIIIGSVVSTFWMKPYCVRREPAGAPLGEA